jgi:LEA14-like dessication related protein
VKKLLVLAAVLLLNACATFNPIAKPEVAITQIGLGPTTGLQQTLNIGLQLDNPNAFDINLGRLRYKLTLAGKSLAGGSYNQPLTLPANDRVSIVVPVEINLLSGIGLMTSIVGKMQDQLEYELSLTAAVENFGFGDITISKSGMVGPGAADTTPGS